MTLRTASVLLLLGVVIAGGTACSNDKSAGASASSGSVNPPAPPASPAQQQQQRATSNQVPTDAANVQQNQAAAQPNQQEQKKPLAFKGTVEGVKAADGMLTVKNDDVPGWGMPAMTMSYHVSNPPVLKSLEAGDRVTATVYEGNFGTLYEVAAAPKGLSKGGSSSMADALPPLSYVCPTRGEENEINDKPGTCEKSSAKLVPIRLVIAYECLKGPAYIQATAGTCRYDKSELAPITASMFWACSDEPDATRYLEPGTCADGSARNQRFEKRPHGDHNPRHGGPYVAMSEDLMHHAEGTFVAPGTFRAYFYDEYTRPMRVAGYTARLVPTDANSREIGQPIPMRAAPSLGPNVMEARIPGASEPTSASPLQFKMHVAIGRASKDWSSDWSFTHYSKEPGNGGPAAPVAPTSAAPVAAPSSTPASSGSASGAFGSALAGGAELGPNGPVQPAPVPPTATGILNELKTHTDAVAQQLQEGNLGGMWLDALRAKDLVITLEQKHENEVPSALHPELSSAVKELTRSAWEIDAAGDLGQAEKITELEQVFADSAARIQKLYATAHQ